VWIGVVLLLAGIGLAGVAAERAWFAAAAVVAGLAMLLGLNIVNPEAMVVRHNVDRATQTEKVDPGYLAELSDDAVPDLVRALPRLPEPARTEVLESICAGREPAFDGWAAANASRRRAMDARRQVCAPSAVTP